MTNWSLALALLNSRKTLRYLNFKVFQTDKLRRSHATDLHSGSELSPCHHMELVCLPHNHWKKIQNDPHGFLSKPGSNDSIWQFPHTAVSWLLLLQGGLCSKPPSLLYQKSWAPLAKSASRTCLLQLSLNDTGGIFCWK